MDASDPKKPKPVQRTPEQRYATHIANAARAKEDMRRLDTRRKVIVGALVIRRARRSPAHAAALIDLIETENRSDTDLFALGDLLGELHLKAHPAEPVRTEPDQSTDGT
jgi:hypothetical protein